MIVVIDSTAVHGDWGFRRWLATRLPDYARTGHELFVPRVVLDEHWGQIARSFREWWEKRPEDAIELIGVSVPELPTEQVASLLQSRKLDLERRLEDGGALILEYPAADHQEVVERAIDRRKPFDAEGQSGYRDTLVWLTVLDLCRRDRTPVALITNDNDFLAKRGNLLHADLLDDLSAEGLSSEAIVPFRNAVQFHNAHVDDRLRLLADIQQEVVQGTHPFNLRSWLESGPIHQIAGMAASLLLSRSGETPTVRLSPTILEVIPGNVRLAEPDRLVIYATARAKVEVGQPQWPIGQLTELAIVSIDLRIVLDRPSRSVLDWDYGETSIEPLLPSNFLLR